MGLLVGITVNSWVSLGTGMALLLRAQARTQGPSTQTPTTHPLAALHFLKFLVTSSFYAFIAVVNGDFLSCCPLAAYFVYMKARDIFCIDLISTYLVEFFSK